MFWWWISRTHTTTDVRQLCRAGDLCQRKWVWKDLVNRVLGTSKTMQWCMRFSVAGITVQGRFSYSGHPNMESENTNTSQSVAVEIMKNGSTLTQAPLDPTKCFAAEFLVEEPGEHVLDLILIRTDNDTCNGTIPIVMKVLQREGRLYSVLRLLQSLFTCFSPSQIVTVWKCITTTSPPSVIYASWKRVPW